MRLRDPDKTNEVGLGHSGGTVHSSSEQVFIVLSPSSSVNIPQTCHCLTTSSKLLASKSNRSESKGFECLGGTSEQWIFVVREKKGEGEILLRVEYWWERDWAGALAMEKWCHWWGYCRQLEMTAGTWCQLCLLAQYPAAHLSHHTNHLNLSQQNQRFLLSRRHSLMAENAIVRERPFSSSVSTKTSVESQSATDYT